MCKEAIYLRRRIDAFSAVWKEKKQSPLPLEDVLSPDDWADITLFLDALKPLYEATLQVQGRQGSVWESLPLLQRLLSHFEQLREVNAFRADHLAVDPPQDQVPVNPVLTICANLAWQKLDKYYTLTDDSDAYVSAIALHPRKRFGWFDRHWGDNEGWIEPAKKAVKAAWRAHQKHYLKDSPPPQTALTSLNADTESEGESDELDDFLGKKHKLGEDEDLLRWWQQHEKDYPRLSHWAFTLLATPSTSSEVERVFSSSKLMISPLRSRLKIDVVEASECLRSWRRQGIQEEDQEVYIRPQEHTHGHEEDVVAT